MANSAELDLPFGGDFTLTPTGDILVTPDTATCSPAMLQRLTRLVFTTPIIRDANNNPIAPADDIFHPNWGAGVRAAVDGLFNATNIQSIRALVLSSLLGDPGVASSPAPIVDVQLIDFKSALLSIVVWTVTGQQVVFPPLPLTPSGA